MVSDFICPCHGRLRLSNGLPAAEIIEPGTNHDGYWQAPHIRKQLQEKAIPAFESMHANAIGPFIFDNSTNHGAFAEDALVASRMKLNPGGKQPPMKDTSFTKPDGTVVPQRMVVENDSKPKGLKLVLQERVVVAKLRHRCNLNPAALPIPTCCARGTARLPKPKVDPL